MELILKLSCPYEIILKENKRLQLLVVLHHVAIFISYYINDIVKIVRAKCELA